jgi:hypothetical protein
MLAGTPLLHKAEAILFASNLAEILARVFLDLGKLSQM